MGALNVAVLAWCAIELGPWALVPLVAFVAVIALGPLAVRRGARPEYWDFASGLLAFTAMAVAAAMTGGPFEQAAARPRGRYGRHARQASLTRLAG
jgi:hypothetical protein